MVLALITPSLAVDKVEISINASPSGCDVKCKMFGQFAEHLVHGSKILTF